MKLENASLRLGYYVERVSCAVDDWGASDSFLRAHSFNRARCNGWAKVLLPERRWTQTVRVKGIDGIVFRGNIHYVVRAACNITQAGNEQRLGVDLAIHRIRELFAEARSVDVGGTQNGFVRIQAGALAVIVVSKHGYRTEIGQNDRHWRCGAHRVVGHTGSTDSMSAGTRGRGIKTCAGNGA